MIIVMAKKNREKYKNTWKMYNEVPPILIKNGNENEDEIDKGKYKRPWINKPLVNIKKKHLSHSNESEITGLLDL